MTADGPIFYKFNVSRTDGAETDPGSKHFGGCQYWVLDVDHDPHARKALATYANECEVSHPQLAADIRRFLHDQHCNGAATLIKHG